MEKYSYIYLNYVCYPFLSGALFFVADTVTPSYVPVKPFPVPPSNPPALEIEEFVPEKGQLSNPHSSYINNLYIYPLSLKFDSQKSFTKVSQVYMNA